MVGIIIYKSNENYHDLILADHTMYKVAKTDIRKNGDEILLKKWGASPEQIDNIKETKENLVKKLNAGEKVDLKKELSEFFRCH